jgi:hypothetical protein
MNLNIYKYYFNTNLLFSKKINLAGIISNKNDLENIIVNWDQL